jgi:hypothetical protein
MPYMRKPFGIFQIRLTLEQKLPHFDLLSNVLDCALKKNKSALIVSDCFNNATRKANFAVRPNDSVLHFDRFADRTEISFDRQHLFRSCGWTQLTYAEKPAGTSLVFL